MEKLYLLLDTYYLILITYYYIERGSRKWLFFVTQNLVASLEMDMYNTIQTELSKTSVA